MTKKYLRMGFNIREIELKTTLRLHPILIILTMIKKKTTTNIGKAVGRENTYSWWDSNLGAATMKISVEKSQKVKNHSTHDKAVSPLGT